MMAVPGVFRGGISRRSSSPPIPGIRMSHRRKSNRSCSSSARAFIPFSARETEYPSAESSRLSTSRMLSSSSPPRLFRREKRGENGGKGTRADPAAGVCHGNRHRPAGEVSHPFPQMPHIPIRGIGGPPPERPQGGRHPRFHSERPHAKETSALHGADVLQQQARRRYGEA